ncbi:hypothetical protein SM124_10650 [Bacillus sp. 31A1R]|uniref:TolA protein n=1 Tax=Robertmurraya mangrovi TaxID=3098077 RepID=A0ABU5IYG7_9BACI|nr:hypothetical protein [Bacillus sp. 31A1R]MDZ5472208.1 hypothetical protein [Bacillus sp. 31A1R]
MLKKIPGFRTGAKWKMIVSLVGHLLIMLLIISSFNGVTVGDKLINGARMLIFMIIPYMLLTNFGNIRERIPLLKKEGRTIGKIIMGTAIWSLVILLSFTAVFGATEGLLSPQQKAIELVKKQQREIEARLKKEAKEREEAQKLAQREAERKAKKEAELQEKIAMAVDNSKGNATKLEEKLVEVIDEETATDIEETETSAVETNTTETDKSELKAAISSAIQEAKGDLAVLQEKLKSSLTKEPEKPKSKQELEIEQAINESQNDDNSLKDKLLEVLIERKEDSVDLKQRIDLMVEESKGDYAALKEKLKEKIQARKDEKAIEAMVEDARKEAEQQAEIEANSPEAKKAQYQYVDYSELTRLPQNYEGMELVNYGTILTTDSLGKNIISVVEVAPGSLIIMAVPKANLEMNVIPNDYIAFYGKFNGVSSSVLKFDLTSIFSYDTIYYQEAMPYYDVQYVDILSW